MKKFFTLSMVVLLTLSLSACFTRRNQPPEIRNVPTANVVIQVGDEFDPLEGITAHDPEDGNITANIVVDGWEDAFRFSTGSHTVTLRVTDSSGAEVSKSYTVIIQDAESTNTPPQIIVERTDITYYVGAGEFNPLAGVIAIDEEDGPLTENITVHGVYLLDQPGTYTIQLRVTDSDGALTTRNITLRVRANPVPNTLGTAPITVSFWHAMGTANEALIRTFANEFIAKMAQDHGANITINLASQGGYADLKTKTIQAIVAQNQPTMLQTYPDHVSEYLNGNSVENLDPYVYHPTWGIDLDDFVPSYIEENTQHDAANTLYSLPFNKSSEVFIYNKTFFDLHGFTPPTTWDELFVIAQQIRDMTDARTDITQSEKDKIIPFAYDSSGNAFITLIRQWGGAYTEMQLPQRTGLYLFDNPEAHAAMSYFRQKSVAKLFTLPDLWELSYASTPFMANQTFMTVGSSAGVRHNIPSGAGAFEVGVAPVPHNPDVGPMTIQQGTNVSIMRGASEQEKLAAWLFLKYLTSEEVTIRWAMPTGYLPVRISAIESAEYQAYLDYENNAQLTPGQKAIAAGAKIALQGLDVQFYDPPFIGSSKARELVGIALERIILGDGNIQAAFNNTLAELRN